jgi:transposase InsO family protein
VRVHPNAKGTANSRLVMVRRIEEEGWSVADAAEAAGYSERSAYKWLRRYRDQGFEGLADRSSAPHRVPGRTSAQRVERIVALRRRRRTAWEIAQRLGLAWSTVSAVLRREGLGRLAVLDAKPPPRRYEREKPGELLHLDVKPLARIVRVGHRIHGDRSRTVYGAGWEFAHVAIDDASRLAYVEVLPDQRGETAVGFLERALRWFRKRRIRVERLLTDNGSCYVARRFRQACKRHRIRHLRTRPYRPETNGKAERFIGTLLRGWAYRRPYRTSNQRTRALAKWLRYYNEQRPHRALGMVPPLMRFQRAR